MTDPERKLPTAEHITNPSGEVVALRFDVSKLLEAEVGEDWQQRVSDVLNAGEFVPRKPASHVTLREQGTTAKLGLVTTNGDILAANFPGIWGLYQTSFRDLMQSTLPLDADPMSAYSFDHKREALEGIVQRPVDVAGSDVIQHRMEAHVDQRYTGVLVIDVPENPADGGRLIISNNPNAQSVAEINEDVTIIQHVAGSFVCFVQGRKYPHYTEEMTNPDTKRHSISMNYPVEGETTEDRQSLQDHIEGKD